jgi:hypothetical protein
MSHDLALSLLRQALLELQNRQVAVDEFCRRWRSQSALLDALPPRYRQVMEDLLGRLEAGSLFTEESCSFSQEDLHGQLAIWLDKAEHTLPTAGKP